MGATIAAALTALVEIPFVLPILAIVGFFLALRHGTPYTLNLVHQFSLSHHSADLNWSSAIIATLISISWLTFAAFGFVALVVLTFGDLDADLGYVLISFAAWMYIPFVGAILANCHSARPYIQAAIFSGLFTTCAIFIEALLPEAMTDVRPSIEWIARPVTILVPILAAHELRDKARELFGAS